MMLLLIVVLVYLIGGAIASYIVYENGDDFYLAGFVGLFWPVPALIIMMFGLGLFVRAVVEWAVELRHR